MTVLAVTNRLLLLGFFKIVFKEGSISNSDGGALEYTTSCLSVIVHVTSTNFEFSAMVFFDMQQQKKEPSILPIFTSTKIKIIPKIEEFIIANNGKQGIAYL